MKVNLSQKINAVLFLIIACINAALKSPEAVFIFILIFLIAWTIILSEREK